MTVKTNFSDDQIAEFQEAFMLFDTEGDGMIPANQVGEVLRALGQNPTEAEVKRLVQNQKTEGRVTFETFIPILQAVSSKPVTDTMEDFVEGLRRFDKDGNGFISSAELRHLLTSLGEKMTEDDVDSLIHGQEDSSGNINYEEFVKMVLANYTSY
uniref:Myosin-2 essential light chain n=1 Tax=Caligus clemensi TaxID=344056 RepID=C1C0P4_CALCM|nr:Myosin-2 essential light chain [Caligus clemensi]